MTEKLRLLVAEDDSEMRALLHKTLTHEGFEVVSVPNGHEALKKLHEDSNYCILISDVRMPHKDGEALVPEVTRDYPHIKVIMISGYAELELYLRLMHKGAFDYVTKPFKIPDLLEVIDRAVVANQNEE